MPKAIPILSPSEPEPALLNTLGLITRICLVMAEMVALLCLCRQAIPALSQIIPSGWELMSTYAALSALCAALSLQLSEPSHSRWMHRFSLVLAALVAFPSIAVFLRYGLHIPFAIIPLQSSGLEPLTRFFSSTAPQVSGGFALMGIALVLIPFRKRATALTADLAVFCLCLLVMVLVCEDAFAALHTFTDSDVIPISAPTVLCILLISVVVALRQARHGIFAVLLGRGIGGRITRLISPITLMMPFVRETTRAHLINAGRMPPGYITAIVVSITAAMSFALLIFIAWRINGMELQIHHLSMRDELTGLYNLRGFQLLAEQTLRLAQRSKLPFSVLFIDLDNLKQINDAYGHSAGSATLLEAGEMLKATFRETDVMGRVGGDEFAVAGQFSHNAISAATQRLRDAAARRNSETGHRFALNFSIGFVTSEGIGHESLKDLLSKADNAMYEEKRRKKSASEAAPA